MSAVADAIEAASDEIFITDWQMNPHIFMKREDMEVDRLYWRLDKMLLRKADQGVKVYMLLYWESKEVAGMDLGSDFVLATLKHKNIEIHRHPDFTLPHRLSHHEKVVVVDCSIAFVAGIDLCFGRWDTHNHELVDNYPAHPCFERENESKLYSIVSFSKRLWDSMWPDTSARYSHWIGKDYGNTFHSGVRTQLDHPMEDYIDRNNIPRMPWHDVGCSITGSPVQDVSKHFIQRYSIHQIDKPLPNFVGERKWSSRLWHMVKNIRPVASHSIPDPSSGNVSIQILQSVDSYSNNSADKKRKTSVHNAYLNLIKNSKHFVYIENQFFVSGQDGIVKNKIMPALADRIILAHANKEDFHVVIVIPLKPEFAGEWEAESGRDLRTISYWNNATIKEGKSSLYRRLEKAGISKNAIPKYFKVYGLRTHGTLNNNLVTEIIYVHTKMMVMDDQVAIIGSANINDRSMRGKRDSEVAVMFEDAEMIDGKMNGRHFEVGKFSHSLRCHLMREHLGLLDKKKYEASDIKVEDPLDTTFRDLISVAAENNGVIYETVFGGKVTPTNHVWNFKDLKNYQSKHGLAKCDPESAKKELDALQGSLVTYPVLFLKDVLEPSALDNLSVYSEIFCTISLHDFFCC
ncbi:phospholipase D2-like [Dysidea avara]|uniref:phospholipase D2-like n=1 Tax=Dysidea avara TaxID=196820 RepID=UPI003332EF5B